jgi:hypothetical protein
MYKNDISELGTASTQVCLLCIVKLKVLHGPLGAIKPASF